MVEYIDLQKQFVKVFCPDVVKVALPNCGPKFIKPKVSLSKRLLLNQGKLIERGRIANCRSGVKGIDPRGFQRLCQRLQLGLVIAPSAER